MRRPAVLCLLRAIRRGIGRLLLFFICAAEPSYQPPRRQHFEVITDPVQRARDAGAA